MARRRGIDLEACSYSDDGAPLEDLEGPDSQAEAWAKAWAGEQRRQKSALRAAGIVCSPRDKVYLWLDISSGGMRRYFWSATAAEAYIRADARSAFEKSRVTRCGPGVGVDGAVEGVRRGRRPDHEYDAYGDTDIL